METTPPILREEVQAFIRACKTFAGFAHQPDGLTEKEREVVMITFLRALERHIVSSSPPPSKASTVGPSASNYH